MKKKRLAGKRIQSVKEKDALLAFPDPTDLPEISIVRTTETTPGLDSEIQLETENPRLLLLLNNINDLVCEIDENGIYRYANNQYKDILGYAPKELIGKNALEFIHPDNLKRSYEQYEKLQENKSKITDTYRFRHKNGEYRVIESKGKVYVNEKQEQRTVVISRDITEQYLSEQAIIASEKKYRGLHQSLMDGYAWVDMNGTIIECNEAFKHMLGYEYEEIYKLNFLDITPQKWHQTELNVIEKQVLINGYSEVLRKEYIHKDGSVFPVELRIYLSKDDDYKPEGMWAIVRDISDEVKAEEIQVKLYQQLEELNNTKDKLLSIMAHDLRGPFNSIIGYAELLHISSQSNDLSNFEEYIQRIESCAKQSYVLLENLLTWANAQTGALKYQPTLLNINTLIEQTISFLLPAADRKKIEIDVSYSDNLSLEIDSDMLKTILRNLLSNAIKFTDIGGSVSIKMIHNADSFTIHINDTGVGMSEESMKSIFEEDNFVTTKGTMAENGSGIGLKLCKDLVQLLNGSIKVTSKINQGTNVSVKFPIQIN